MREYFSHDFNARNDRKMIRLAMRSGMAGVGLYWCIVEMLYEEQGELPLSEVERIAFELRVEPVEVLDIIRAYDLFENDGTKFWSESVKKRINIQIELSSGRSKAAQARWQKFKAKQVNADGMQMHNDCNAIKIKESKEKESKGKEIDTNSLPAVIKITDKEQFENRVIEYTQASGISEQLAIEFCSYWTERNQRGKMRWQLEKTFEIPNRMATWRRNAEKTGFQKGGEVKKNSVAAMKDNYQMTMQIINNDSTI